MFVCCKCRVLSGRGLGDGLITRPEESYCGASLCVIKKPRKAEAKARYRAVENTATLGCNAKKRNSMTLQVTTLYSLVEYKLFGGKYCLRILNISSNSDEQLYQTCSQKTINTTIITNYKIYFLIITYIQLQLCCRPVAVVIMHIHEYEIRI
jgi:hypothetical protein